MNFRVRLAPAVSALLLLASAGCAVGPDYRVPQAASLGVPTRFSIAPPSDATPGSLAWWRTFGDPELTKLVEEGAAANLDVAVALTRLRQSREQLVQSRAAQFPSVSASAGASRSGVVSGPGVMANNLSLGVDAAWQADLFGGVSRSVEAARADAAASRFDYGAVVISVQSEIARNYLQLRLQQAQLAITSQSLANQDDNLQITAWRRQAGLASQLDVEQARTQRAHTAAALAQLASQSDQSAAQIALLLGREPGALRAELANAAPIPAGPPAIAVGLPADLLRQRPDVRAAERTLAAATARIGVAQAQLYPALALSGNLGTQAASAGGLFDVITGGAFASLTRSIFDAGRLRSQVRSQRFAAEGALAAYRKTVLTALSDVENALSALRAADHRAASYAAAADAAQNAAQLARDQYRSGLIDFTSLLTSENQLLATRNSLAQAQSDYASAQVQLFTALGGGWDETAAIPGETTSSRTTP